ncbi:hypothetical protein [Desulfamplus magnetovallimortis]|uniref:hypothetical protein n=1 Tax=Desulfamplus magnetovallimortis TaxID=1246637 RepID=UPI0009B9E95A|nr:hypothetical protein [Desulfamplus magnetovallimortis]
MAAMVVSLENTPHHFHNRVWRSIRDKACLVPNAMMVLSLNHGMFHGHFTIFEANLRFFWIFPQKE